MKVLHVVHGYSPEPSGGTEHVAASLVEGLSARGHELRVMAGSLRWREGFKIEETSHRGIPVTRVLRDDPWYDRWYNGYHPGVEREYRALLRRFKPQIVHVHHWLRLTRNLIQAAAEEGVPAVVHLHDFHATCPGTFRLPQSGGFCMKAASPEGCAPCLERWPFQGNPEIRLLLDHCCRDLSNEIRAAHKVIALSRAQASLTAAHLGCELESMEVLPPGAPMVLARARMKQQSRGGPLRIAHWGNLYADKGTLDLVDAFREASKEAPMELLLVGEAQDPDFRRTLEKRMSGLSIEFRGPFVHRDLEAVDADLAVYPSRCFETYGLVVDEAFMLGIPVIVSSLGAPAERIRGGGLTVPPGDPSALAQALVRLAKDRDELARLASGVHRCWISAEESVERVEALYQEILDGRGTPLPPADPVTLEERLELFWFQAAARLASLVGSNVTEPPPWRDQSK